MLAFAYIASYRNQRESCYATPWFALTSKCVNYNLMPMYFHSKLQNIANGTEKIPDINVSHQQ